MISDEYKQSIMNEYTEVQNDLEKALELLISHAVQCELYDHNHCTDEANNEDWAKSYIFNKIVARWAEMKQYEDFILSYIAQPPKDFQND